MAICDVIMPDFIVVGIANTAQTKQQLIRCHMIGRPTEQEGLSSTRCVSGSRQGQNYQVHVNERIQSFCLEVDWVIEDLTVKIGMTI